MSRSHAHNQRMPFACVLLPGIGQQQQRVQHSRRVCGVNVQDTQRAQAHKAIRTQSIYAQDVCFSPCIERAHALLLCAMLYVYTHTHCSRIVVRPEVRERAPIQKRWIHALLYSMSICICTYSFAYANDVRLCAGQRVRQSDKP